MHFSSNFHALFLDDGDEYITEYPADFVLVPSPSTEIEAGLPYDFNTSISGSLKITSKHLFIDSFIKETPLIRLSLSKILPPTILDTDTIKIPVKEATLLPVKYYASQPRCLSPFSSIPMEALHIKIHSKSSPSTLQQITQGITTLANTQATLNFKAILLDFKKEPPQFDITKLSSQVPPIKATYRVHISRTFFSEHYLMALTSDGLYFQSLSSSSPSIPPIHLPQMKIYTRRALGLLDVAVEIALGKTRNTHLPRHHLYHESTLFLMFPHVTHREHFIHMMKKNFSSLPCIENTQRPYILMRLQELWSHGILSNFHYIEALNFFAGRSNAHSSIFPIFPWTIIDFNRDSLNVEDGSMYRRFDASVGSQDDGKVQLLRTRMESLSDEDQFLFGSFYSSPALTSYWRLRTCPEACLKLHNGKFDAWNRLFHSIESSWTANTRSGYSELIADFYSPEAKDFMLNCMQIEVENKNFGRSIFDVDLPIWAGSDGDAFLRGMREALESAYTSSHLHKWIDLIFGCCQRGEVANISNNLFRRPVYLGVEAEETSLSTASPISSISLTSPISPISVGVDPSLMSDALDEKEPFFDDNEKRVLQLELMHFGICPNQIFTTSHPNRHFKTTFHHPTSPNHPNNASLPWFVVLENEKSWWEYVFGQHAPSRLKDIQDECESFIVSLHETHISPNESESPSPPLSTSENEINPTPPSKTLSSQEDVLGNLSRHQNFIERDFDVKNNAANSFSPHQDLEQSPKKEPKTISSWLKKMEKAITKSSQLRMKKEFSLSTPQNEGESCEPETLAMECVGNSIVTSKTDGSIKVIKYPAQEEGPVLTQSLSLSHLPLSSLSAHDSSKIYAGSSTGDVLLISLDLEKMGHQGLKGLHYAPKKHYDTISQIQYDFIGQRLLTASADQSIISWDCHDGRIACCDVFDGHNEAPTCLHSGDGMVFVSADEVGDINVWDPRMPFPCIWKCRSQQHLHGITLLPGNTVTAVSSDSILMWDVRKTNKTTQETPLPSSSLLSPPLLSSPLPSSLHSLSQPYRTTDETSPLPFSVTSLLSLCQCNNIISASKIYENNIIAIATENLDVLVIELSSKTVLSRNSLSSTIPNYLSFSPSHLPSNMTLAAASIFEDFAFLN